MAQFSDAQLKAMADVLNGTHNSFGTVYSGMYGRGQPSERLSAGWPWQPGSEALDAIEGVSPAEWNSGQPTAMAYAPSGNGMPELPRRRPPNAPTAIDMAAIKAQAASGAPPVNSVTGKMGFNPLFGTPVGSALSLLSGKMQLPGGLMGRIGQMLQQPQAAPQAKRPAVSYAQPGMSTAKAYDAANQRAKSTAIQRSSHPSGNSARASLASSWGFD